MAEDLADGRLGVTEEALARHGLSRTAMEQDPAPGSVAALVGDQAGLVRAGLAGARELVDLVPEPNRPMVRALVTLQGHRLRSAERAGATLARRPAPRPLGSALLTLLRAYAGTFRHRARP